MKNLVLPARARSAARSPLALWHLASLDAPCVAALWACFFARCSGVPLPWTAAAALALAVWMLYVADRLADSVTGHALEERHRFHRQHQAVLAVSWLCSAPLLLLLVLHLSHALREGWLLLGIPLAVYVAAVHALGLRHVPKEPLIATFFGVAVTLPMLAAGLPPIKFAATGVLFALLCWLNCAAITAWEASNDGYTDPLTAWVGRHVPAVAAVLMVLAAAALLRSAALEQVGRPAIAIALAALALLMLHTFRARFQRTSLRAFADLCLMTPLLLIAGPVR